MICHAILPRAKALYILFKILASLEHYTFNRARQINHLFCRNEREWVLPKTQGCIREKPATAEV